MDSLSNPSADQYDKESQIAIPGNNHHSVGGTLPFTGFDIGILIFCAVILVSIGIALRKAF